MRKPLSPQDYDVRRRGWERAHPGWSHTSGKRSEKHNEEVGGSPESKHLISMADDYAMDVAPSPDERSMALAYAIDLGLWALYHKGHLHMQGLPPGEIHRNWLDRWMKE